VTRDCRFERNCTVHTLESIPMDPGCFFFGSPEFKQIFKSGLVWAGPVALGMSQCCPINIFHGIPEPRSSLLTVREINPDLPSEALRVRQHKNMICPCILEVGDMIFVSALTRK
jgi:hypothetical protein